MRTEMRKCFIKKWVIMNIHDKYIIGRENWGDIDKALRFDSEYLAEFWVTNNDFITSDIIISFKQILQRESNGNK